MPSLEELSLYLPPDLDLDNLYFLYTKQGFRHEDFQAYQRSLCPTIDR